MASYRLPIKPSAVKELEALPLGDRQRVIKKIQVLADDPRPHGFDNLSGLERYRIRHGDFRVIHAVENHDLAVAVFKIGHRRDVYR